MKKLMIVAAAAAIVGGASAASTETYTWCTDKDALFDGVTMNTKIETNDVDGIVTTNYVYDNKIKLDKLQIVTFKQKATSSKMFCLNDEKNTYDTTFKPSAMKTDKFAAVDGAIYYDGSVWVKMTWNKDNQSIAFLHTSYDAACCWRGPTDDEFGSTDGKTFDYKALAQLYVENGSPAPVDFDCYYDKGGKKVWGAVNVCEMVKGWNVIPTFLQTDNEVTLAQNLVATMYGEIDTANDIAKNIKYTGNDYTVSLKTYKDAASFDKAVEAIEKKFTKVGGFIPLQK